MPNSSTHAAQTLPKTADALAEAIAQRCDNARQTGNGFEACCPAHEDTTPSLSITPDTDKILLHCHAGCPVDAIVAALGMTMADLFLRPPPSNGQKRIVKVYEYCDAQGNLVHETVRYVPKDFKQRRPHPAKPGAYVWNLQGIEPVLYHLPEVLAAVQRGEVIYLAEGEKDVDALGVLGLVATCNAMGAGKWRTSYTEALRDAHVVILPDHDEPGQKHALRVAKALDGVAATLKIVSGIDTGGPGSDVSDWLQAGGTRAELEALAEATPLWTPAAAPLAVKGRRPVPDMTQNSSAAAHTPPESEEEDPRPVIRITTAMTAVVDQGQAALLALPDAPVIFQRARRLCIIAHGVTPPLWLHRPPDAPVILEGSPARLCELVSHAARWQKYDARKHEWNAALPPSWFVETLQGRPAWPFPVLEGILGAPTLRPDGSVLDTPGYDVSTGLWLDTNGTRYPALADHPTINDARKAVNAVKDVLQDFPFVGSGLAAALSALLSVVCRFTIQGCVPLFAARSTTRGSGKGLLIDVLSIIGTGRPAPRWPQSDNDEEDRKRLLTVAMAGDATMHIDNVVKPLGSPALDLALTAPSVTDRILGKTAKVEAPLTLVWFASGNNMQFKGDTARRVVPMDIDPQTERPEERTGFAYPRLLDHVRHVRPALVSAALTIVHAYFQAGTPAQGLSPYGSFQEWSDLIRSAVVWAGEQDPCEDRKGLEAESDPQYEYLSTLLACWQECYPDTAVTLLRALQDISLQAQPIDPNNPANKWHALRDALSVFDSTYRGQRLNPPVIGAAMSRIVGRIIDKKRFVRGSKRTEHGYPWQVTPVENPVGSVGPVGFSDTPPESVREKNTEVSQSQRENTQTESLTLSGKLLEKPTEPTEPTGPTPDTPSSVSPLTCPDGGQHNYLKHAAPRHCTRCNALEGPSV